MKKQLLITFFTAITSAVILAGCGIPTKVTGGGWIASNSGDGKANFGFNAEACEDPFKAVGHFNFHDKKGLVAGTPLIGGVKMNGKVAEASKCIANDTSAKRTSGCQVCESLLGVDGKVGYNAIVATYDSTNPKAPGTGVLYACAKDNGEGKFTESDKAVISVSGGPFDGYLNMGDVQGNIQNQSCDR